MRLPQYLRWCSWRWYSKCRWSRDGQRLLINKDKNSIEVNSWPRILISCTSSSGAFSIRMSHFLHGRRRDSDRCRHFEAKGRAVRRTVPNSSHYTGHQTPSTKHTATFEWLTIWQTYAKARNSDIQFRLTDNYWIIWLISWNFTWDKPVCYRWASAPDQHRFGNNHWRKPAKFCWLPLHNREHKLICWPWLMLALRDLVVGWEIANWKLPTKDGSVHASL